MSENTTPITAAQALELFTGKDDPRAWVNSPVLDGEHVCATNGHWLIRVGSALVDLPQPGGRETAQPNLQKIFAAHWRDLRDNAVPLSALALPDPEPCSQCSGSGKWRASDCESCDGEGWFWHFDHEYACKACETTGRARDSEAELSTCDACRGHGICIEHSVFDVGGQHFSLHYLQLLKRIPGCRFDPGDGGDEVGLFTFPLAGGGVACGILIRGGVDVQRQTA